MLVGGVAVHQSRPVDVDFDRFYDCMQSLLLVLARNRRMEIGRALILWLLGARCPRVSGICGIESQVIRFWLSSARLNLRLRAQSFHLSLAYRQDQQWRTDLRLFSWLLSLVLNPMSYVMFVARCKGYCFFCERMCIYISLDPLGPKSCAMYIIQTCFFLPW